MPEKSAMWAKWMQKMHHVLLHRNDDRQVKAKPKCYIPNKSFPDKTCHNPPGARHIVTNNLDRATEGHDKTKESQMETQDDYTADFRGLHIVPIVFAQGDHRCKVGNAIIKQCTKGGISLELENRSENMVSDRNCMLHQEDKTANLAGEEEQEIPHILMEGNHTTKCSRVLEIFV